VTFFFQCLQQLQLIDSFSSVFSLTKTQSSHRGSSFPFYLSDLKVRPLSFFLRLEDGFTALRLCSFFFGVVDVDQDASFFFFLSQTPGPSLFISGFFAAACGSIRFG